MPKFLFIYGRPDREFDNRWDLIDPDSLTWAESVDLIYRALNGEVLLDTSGREGGYISSFTLESSGGFIPDAYNPPLDVPISIATPSTIYLFADFIEPGCYSLGTILNAGLTAEQYESIMERATFIGRSGSGNPDPSGVGQEMALVYEAVPEPSAHILILWIVGIMMVLVSKETRTRVTVP